MSYNPVQLTNQGTKLIKYNLHCRLGMFSPELRLRRSSGGTPPELRRSFKNSAGAPSEFTPAPESQKLRRSSAGVFRSSAGAPPELSKTSAGVPRSSVGVPRSLVGAPSELRKNFRSFEGSGSGVLPFFRSSAGAPPELRPSSVGAPTELRRSPGATPTELWRKTPAEFFCRSLPPPEFYSFFLLFPELRRTPAGAPPELQWRR